MEWQFKLLTAMLRPGARPQKEFIVSTKLMTTKVMFFSLKTAPNTAQGVANELLYSLFLCGLRSDTVLLHLRTCFLRIVLGPSAFMRLVQQVVGIFMFLFLLMGDSLVRYRAAIGLFNCFKFVSRFIVFFASNIIY